MLSDEKPLLHGDVQQANSSFGRYTEVGHSSVVLNSELGDYSYCGPNCDIANTSIGKFSNIASNVRIGPTDHPMHTASLHHFMYRSSWYWDDAEDDTAFFAARSARRAFIGHDTWIGHGVIIKPDVTIGHGAVIAAGAIVTKDVAPYTIVGGVTARLIRERLPGDIAERLMDLAWWDWPHDEIRAALNDFRALSAGSFLDKYQS